MERNKVYIGNNLDILKTFPDNSIDSIVTDPPYGLGKEPNAAELLQSWITTGYHEVKGKGFMGKEWDAFVPQPLFWRECFRVLKHGGHLLSFAGTRTYDWVVMGLRLSGFEIRDQIAWVYGSGFPKSQNISIFIDKQKKLQGHRGKATHAFLVGNKRAGDGKEIEASKKMEQYEPKSDEAKQWQGWGSALKPALEPIVMARKPLDGTIADNVLKHGVGGINIDGCRVGSEHFTQLASEYEPSNGIFSDVKRNAKEYNGRFPANFIHDGSDEVVALFPSVGGGLYKEANARNRKGFMLGDVNGTSNAPDNYGDSGSAARFFYTAKASQTERNWGLDGFDEKQTTGGGGGIGDYKNDVNSASGKYGSEKAPSKNIHPTVKPLDLMQYLVRLVTPKGGVCLDPFLGSGTTAVAAKAEKFDYIGIELQPEYAEIAKARIKAEIVQYDIFDVLEANDE